MALPVFPSDVIRTLSFHGPVDVLAGPEQNRVKFSVFCAPFEDVLFLFVKKGSALEEALLDSCTIEIHARYSGKSEDGDKKDYSLRMPGRAFAGPGLASHADRGTLMPWAPEGISPSQYCTAPFVADAIEFFRTEANERVRYFGETSAKKEQPSRFHVWLTAMFVGVAFPFAALAIAVPWLWLAVQGPTYPYRPLALGISVGAGLSLLGATRLFALRYAFLRWREGRANKDDAPILSTGLLSPGDLRRVVAWLSLAAVIQLSALLVGWEDPVLVGIAAFVNGAWLLGPAWMAHLTHSKAESGM